MDTQPSCLGDFERLAQARKASVVLPQCITASSTTRTRKAAIARQGLKSENGHYYLLSYYEDGKGIGVALHQADDPGVPLYEEIDYKVVNKEPLEQLQARVKVAADGKLIL